MMTRQAALVSASAPTGASAPGPVPATFACVLILVCVFAPYGMSGALGGTLRLDHIFIPFAAAVFIARRRVRRPCILAVALLIYLAINLVSTGLRPELVIPSDAAKNLEALMRGPFVLMLFSSVDVRDTVPRAIERTLTFICVTLALMAMTEIYLSADHPFTRVLISAYGGPVGDDGIYGLYHMNHKEIMIRSERTSAVFITPPSLGMSSVFFLLFALNRGLVASRLNRTVIIVAALISGFLCVSKSFLFALPIIVFLSYPTAGVRLTLTLVIVVVAAVTLPDLLNSPEFLESVTGGRYGSDIAFTTNLVLNDSPLVGYGFGHHPFANYADSAMNRYLLGGGILGLATMVIGMLAQGANFFERRTATPWAMFGVKIIVVALAFGVTGPLTYMPRINDLFFMFVGLSVAAVEQERRRGCGSDPEQRTTIFTGRREDFRRFVGALRARYREGTRK